MIACKADRAAEFLGMITKEFLLKFKENLGSNFGYGVFDFDDEEIWINLGSTMGWGHSFIQTCLEMNLPALHEYYNALEWFDSDVFDGDISDLAIEYGIIRPMSVSNNDETEVL
jgi:hypothetical protein